MERYESLTNILQNARDLSREIRFIDGDKDETALPFGHVWDDALRLLGSLQEHGMQAGDELQPEVCYRFLGSDPGWHCASSGRGRNQ